MPYWRADIHIPEDIIEEVGRLAGYDTINLTLPTRDFVAVQPTAFDQLRTQLRSLLVRAGANEVLTYSFVHGDVLHRMGHAPERSYRITNSISPDLQYYRQSLTPSLVSLIHPNNKAGYSAFALFELNKVHDVATGLTHEDVPVEHDRLALVIAHSKATTVPFYTAKRYLDFIAEHLGLEFTYSVMSESHGIVGDNPMAAPYEPKRSAVVANAATGALIGVVGEFAGRVSKAAKLPGFAAGFEIDTRALAAAVQAAPKTYRPLSRYPSTERDICFQVPAQVPYAAVIGAVRESLATTDLITSVEPLDIYQAGHDAPVKNITVRIRLTSYDTTLQSSDSAAIERQVIEATTAATGGKVL